MSRSADQDFVFYVHAALESLGQARAHLEHPDLADELDLFADSLRCYSHDAFATITARSAAAAMREGQTPLFEAPDVPQKPPR